jgi:hypothetical protein
MKVPHAYYAKARTCPAASSGVRLRQFDYSSGSNAEGIELYGGNRRDGEI